MAKPNNFDRSNPLASIGDLTVQQMNNNLRELAAPLIEEGFREEIFDATIAAEAGYQYGTFHKMMKYVVALLNSDLLDEILVAGQKANLFSSPLRCTFTQFCAWIKWLKSEAGRKAMYSEQQNKKRKSRAQEAKLECFSKMRQVYAYERRRAIKEAKVEMDEIRRLREKKLQADIKAIEQKYLPVASYEDPEENVVANLAYKLYTEEAEQRNEKPIDRVVGGLGEALRLKGEVARQTLERNHTMQPKFEPHLLNIC